MTHSAQQPEITVTTMDYDRLTNLAESMEKAAPDTAAFLLEELDRASIAVAPPDSVVRMGSYVYFRDVETETVQKVRLVYPDQSDTRQGHVSILTPIGTALLGLSAGQTFKWRDRRGTLKALTVLAVHDAADAPSALMTS